MKEEVKNEITYIAKKQSKDRLIRWLLISISLIVMLAGAGVMNWLSERDKSKVEILDAVTDLKTELKTGFKSVNDKQSAMEQTIIEIQSEQSEQKQIMNVVVKRLPEQDKESAERIREIYDQMRRDQSPRDRKESAGPEAMIEPLSVELKPSSDALVLSDTKKKIQ